MRVVLICVAFGFALSSPAAAQRPAGTSQTENSSKKTAANRQNESPAPPPGPCQPNALSIVTLPAHQNPMDPPKPPVAPPRGAQSFPYHLGDILSIRASGDCQKQLMVALSNTGTQPAATLHFNHVPMVGMPLRSIDAEGDDASILNFSLERDPGDPAARAAWDRFLGAEKKADFPVTVAVSIGNDRAVPVPVRGVTFGVAEWGRVQLAIILGSAAFVVALLALLLAPRALRNDDGRFSLGKSQLAFWGLLLFITEAAMAILTKRLEPIPNSILMLAGISAATGVIAFSTETSKRATKRQTKRSSIWNFVTDICDGGSGFMFHRLQAFLWTLLLGGLFFWSVVKTMSMPDFDSSLLLLMGITSGTYIGFKVPEAQRNQAPNEPARSEVETPPQSQ